MKTPDQILAEIDNEISRHKEGLESRYNSHGFKFQLEHALDVLVDLKKFVLSEPECEHTPDNLGLGHCSKCGSAL